MRQVTIIAGFSVSGFSFELKAASCGKSARRCCTTNKPVAEAIANATVH
jgi:hypothetical protein